MKIVRLDKTMPLPEYQTAGAAAMDVRAGKTIYVNSMSVTSIPTGIAVEIPIGWELQVRPRSGLAAKEQITVANSPGTIDSDFRGEINVLLLNLGSKPFLVKKGDRIAQIVLCPIKRITWEEVEELPMTARGTGGFGSTGV